MSAIKITSNIERSIEGAVGSSVSIKNTFASEVEGGAEKFVADYSTTDSWILDPAQGLAFNENILRVIDTTVDGQDVSFIHIQCSKRIITSTDQPDPIRFDVTINGVLIGAMSQFQLANCKLPVPLTPDVITISNVAVPANAQAAITVIVGFNK